ncbi:MAG: protealysin inhibitor emfourin [Gemmatimonas sp.]|nr:protealysin inhibitor emfourin [Gemmatimonadaceae bacterium]
MRTQLRFLVLLAAVAGCTHRDPTTSPAIRVDDFGALNASKIELVAEGGIAALLITDVVRHDDRFYLHTIRHLCTQTCAAPLDSATGTLSASAADSLFSLVWAQSPFSLKDDYGTMNVAADAMTYTLRMTFDGTTKTVRADDGTMPPQMRQIVDVLRGTISAARK